MDVRRCLTCRRPLGDRGADARCCSDACRAAWRRQLRRVRRRALLYAAYVLDAPLPAAVRDRVVRLCPACRSPVSADARRDALYCSHACRQRAYLTRTTDRPAIPGSDALLR